MKKELVILTDNFGLNTSGGSIATARIFEAVQDHFEVINVISKTVGNHNFRNLISFKYDSMLEAIRIIKMLNARKNIIFYGDFYTAYYFVLASVPFYFTYHDNWPEQKSLSLSNFLKSFFYVPIYRLIFKKCEALINVSAYKYGQNNHYNNNAHLIRNGLNAPVSKTIPTPLETQNPLRIVMLGNIDNRKFGLASTLFQQMASMATQVVIDIYGKIIDQNIAKKMAAFNFVHIHGYTECVDFNSYHLLLSVSKMENLSIAVCEALANSTPVIAFDIGGLKEVIKHRSNGILIERYDVSLVIQAIDDYAQGKLKFEFNPNDFDEYDWNISARQYLQILHGENVYKKDLTPSN